jgi:hypothetical protein
LSGSHFSKPPALPEVTDSLHYESSINASVIYLWDALAVAPTSGTSVIGWSQRGDLNLHLVVPPFAATLTVLIPLAATVSVSLSDGERLLSIETGETDLWTQRARLVCGTQVGPWMSFYPDGHRKPSWQALGMDCHALADGQSHSFWIELETNSTAFQHFPYTVSADDCALWTRLPAGGLRPDTLAVFSRI